MASFISSKSHSPVKAPRQRAPHPSDEALIAGRKGMDARIDDGVSNLPMPDCLEEFWTTIPTTDGWESRCKVIQPKSSPTTSSQRRPLIVYFYGGGHMAGNPALVTRPAREWAEAHNATVVCPSYRLAPEWTWPMFMTDGWDVVSWLSRNAEHDDRFRNVNLDDGFVIGGMSAGGGIAGVIAGISALLESGAHDVGVERLGKPITGLFVCITMFVTEEILPDEYRAIFRSREDNRHVQGVNTAGIERVVKAIRCDDYTSPWFSPINIIPRLGAPQPTQVQTSDAHTLPHPRTYIQACAFDPLRDDSIIYEDMLSNLPGMAGEVKMDLFPDDPHTAWTAIPFPAKSQSPTIAEATMDGMRWLIR